MDKKFIFVVTLISGATLLQSGYGRNIDCALMDACEKLSLAGEYPEEDIVDVSELKSQNIGQIIN